MAFRGIARAAVEIDTEQTGEYDFRWIARGVVDRDTEQTGESMILGGLHV